MELFLISLFFWNFSHHMIFIPCLTKCIHFLQICVYIFSKNQLWKSEINCNFATNSSDIFCCGDSFNYKINISFQLFFFSLFLLALPKILHKTCFSSGQATLSSVVKPPYWSILYSLNSVCSQTPTAFTSLFSFTSSLHTFEDQQGLLDHLVWAKNNTSSTISLS